MLKCLCLYEEVTTCLHRKSQDVAFIFVFRAFLPLLSETYIYLKYLMLVLNLSSFIWQMYQKILLGSWSYPKVKK